MGLNYPEQVRDFVDEIGSLLKSEHEKIRERAIGALGRIGRADYHIVLPYWNEILKMSQDPAPAVRMNFIWASENIGTNAPALFENHMEIYAALLDDNSTRVRIEAPEIFRVIGKRKPEYVSPYLEKLSRISECDEDRVVRIHSAGAIKATIGR